MPSLEDLPYELIEIIMTYLNPSDRRVVSLVSKRLAEVADDVSKIRMIFDHCRLEDTCEPLNVFNASSGRHYNRLYIGLCVEYGTSMERFCHEFGPHLTELTFGQFKSESISFLKSLLRHCRESLERLTIVCDMDSHVDPAVLELDTLMKLKKLCFCSASFTKDSFDGLKPLFNRLESMHFYFRSSQLEYQVLTYQYMLDCVQGTNITDLVLADYFPSGFYRYKDAFEAHTDRHGYKKLSIPMTHAFCWGTYLKKNHDIIEYGNPNGAVISPECLNLLARLLPNLQVLKIKIESERRIENLNFLCEFNELRVFSCFNIGHQAGLNQGDDHKLHGLKKNLKMKSFTLQNCDNLCHLCFKRIVESYPNLRVLDLQRVNINDENLQLAITKLTFLRELNISGCSSITNNGLENVSSLKGLQTLKIDGTAINSLTLNLPELIELSVARTQILNIVFVDCFSIEVLNFLGCSNVTDDSLALMLGNMQRLKELYIGACSKLTPATLEYLATNCPKLQVLGCLGCNFCVISQKALLSRISSLKYAH